MAIMLSAISSLLKSRGSPAPVAKEQEAVNVHTASITCYGKDGKEEEFLQFLPVFRPKPRRGLDALKLDTKRVIEIGKPSSGLPKPKFSTVHFHKYDGPSPKVPSRKEVWAGTTVVDLDDPNLSFLARKLEYSPCVLLTTQIRRWRGYLYGLMKGWKGAEDYYFLVKKMNDAMIMRFSVAEKAECLGRGNSGNVYSGIDTHTKEEVAIKISKSGTWFSILEIASAIKVQRFSNILRLKGFFLISADSHALVYERVPSTLFHDIYDRSVKKRPYSISQIAFIASQLLTTLSEMHPRFIHTDITCSNISANFDAMRCILLDLGGIKDIRTNPLEPIITQQPFRSPESILGDYDCKTDIFSLGCVVFNLFALDYLFPYKIIDRYVDPVTKTEIGTQAERDSIWQLALIQAILGPIPEEMLKRSKNFEKYYSGRTFKFPLSSYHAAFDRRMVSVGRNELGVKELADFVKKCLIIDPLQRPSAKALLDHPFIQSAPKRSKVEKKG